MIERFVVIPGLDRHDLTAALLADLGDRPDRIFLYDNGSHPPYASSFAGTDRLEVVDAADWPFHAMWNDGLRRARARAAECDVAFLNNDIRCGTQLLARMGEHLRSRPDIWLAYADETIIEPDGWIVPEFPFRAVQGHAFMIRGECGLEFDERYEWWYGDWDMEMQVRRAGKLVIAVGHTGLEHKHETMSTRGPRLEQARRDELRFALKWGLDPTTMFLASNPDFGLA